MGRSGGAARGERCRAAAPRAGHDGAARAQLRLLRPPRKTQVSEGSHQRVALVTGGSRGLGRAMAIRLAGAGHRLVVNYASNADAAEKVVAGIEEKGGEAIAVQADVSQGEQVERLFEEAGERLGPVAVLVNNAGVTRDRLLLRMSAADFDHVIDTNLKSTFLCTKAALRGMLRAKWGRVISIASVAGLVGNAGQANYGASKAGMIGFSKSVAKEVGSRGITVNVVAPGFVATDLTADLVDKAKEVAEGRISLGRFGTPEEIAAVVAFLASDEAAYMTGQVISVDGGLAL
ncbi:MAG: 3-oxoacyl-[acyl-carrier-protein] reductase [Actinobacteria bacterium]|nr:3-oxoacyl-[acyl-carrier-protein] reductase [Actinomycetota bacterium]